METQSSPRCELVSKSVSIPPWPEGVKDACQLAFSPLVLQRQDEFTFVKTATTLLTSSLGRFLTRPATSRGLPEEESRIPSQQRVGIFVLSCSCLLTLRLLSNSKNSRRNGLLVLPLGLVLLVLLLLIIRVDFDDTARKDTSTLC